METKKAWDPSTYISYVASDGRSWGRHNLEAGCEGFFRSTVQPAWISKERGKDLEDVFINHNDRRILFLGCQELTIDRSEHLYAGRHQPFCQVVHAAGG